MHHKRHRPKNRRAGCLMCKPWKVNGVKNSFKQKSVSDRRAIIAAQHMLKDLELGRWDSKGWSKFHNEYENDGVLTQGEYYIARRLCHEEKFSVGEFCTVFAG